VVLLEAEQVGFGASGRNAGMLVPLLAPLWLVPRSLPYDEARWGLHELDRRLDQIAVDLGSLDGGPAASTWYLSAPSALAAEVVGWLHDRLTAFGQRSEMISGPETDRRIGEAARLSLVKPRHLIHPARLAIALGERLRSMGVPIYEHARVKSIDHSGTELRAITETGITCRARKIVSAAGPWAKGLFANVDGRLWETWMVATAPLPADVLARMGGTQTMVVSAKPDLMYRRVHAGRLLLGGLDDGVTQPSPAGHVPDNVLPRLKRLMHESLPWLGEVPLEYIWGGPMHVYWDQKPRIIPWRVDPRVVLVSGMSGSGVIWSLFAGELAAGLVDPALEAPDDRRIRELVDRAKVPPLSIAQAGLQVVGRTLFSRRRLQD
jgi:gamma-glutamylputrescine oxidase